MVLKEKKIKFAKYMLICQIFFACVFCTGQDAISCYKQGVDFRQQISDFKGVYLELSDDANKLDTSIFEERNCLVICLDSSGCISFNKHFQNNNNKLEYFIAEFIDNPYSNNYFPKLPSHTFIYVIHDYVPTLLKPSLPIKTEETIKKKFNIVFEAISMCLIKLKDKFSRKIFNKEFNELKKDEKLEIINRYKIHIKFMPNSY